MSSKPSARWIAVAAAVEVGTALVLLIRPTIFVRLLFGAALPGAGQALSRLAGIALIALALACWPREKASSEANSALPALLVFSLLAALYLVYVGIRGELVGVLLWPAAATHAGLAILLARAWLKGDG
jgi:hypothetical protein